MTSCRYRDGVFESRRGGEDIERGHCEIKSGDDV